MNFLSLCVISLVVFCQALVAADPLAVFPKTVEEMQKRVEEAKLRAKEEIAEIVSISDEDRTYENTVIAYDHAVAHLYMLWGAISNLQMVHPDPVMHREAENCVLQLQEFAMENFDANRKIYEAHKAYQQKGETLNPERAYALGLAMKGFKEAGFELDAASFARVVELNKSLSHLCTQFYKNIDDDNSTLSVTKDELLGLDETKIQGLDRDGEHYLLRMDAPTALEVLRNCEVEKTRKAYYHLYANRAYPENYTLLEEIVKMRHELATTLGYSSFAALDIASQMAQTPERVEAFLEKKAETAVENAKKVWHDISGGSGLIKSWDLAYLSRRYKEEQLGIDYKTIADYFPFDSTMKGIFSVLGSFLSMNFEQVAADLWHEDVFMVKVTAKDDGALIGYIVLDLFPRQNKYFHFCCNSIAAPHQDNAPALAVVIANITKPPGHLSHGQLIDVFHELGHAIHALTGTAELTRKSAYNTTSDFVETPSQLFEEWALEPEVLYRIGKHYQTQEPLSDEMIEALVSLNLEDGTSGTATSEITYSLISLKLFDGSAYSDITSLHKQIHEKILPGIAWCAENHHIATFAHLVDAIYSAKYYGYLWSKSHALSFYAYIKAHGGPLDPEVGRRYVTKVIGVGGSKDPNDIVQDFLEEKAICAACAAG